MSTTKYLLYLYGDQGLLTIKLLNKFTNNIKVVLPAGLDNSELENYCINNNINLYYKEKGKSIDIKSLDVDILISSAFQYKIPAEEFNSVKLLAINIHASILPLYKGKHSDVWALINDEKVLGITVHRLNEHFDDGEILNIYTTEINDSLKNKDIYEKITDLFPLIIQDIISNKILIRNQNLIKTKDVFWRKRTLNDSLIDWHKSARYIFLFVRALSRNPIFAYSFYKSKKYIFEEVAPSNIESNELPGTVIMMNDSFYIVCGNKETVKVLKMNSDSEVLINGEVLH